VLAARVQAVSNCFNDYYSSAAPPSLRSFLEGSQSIPQSLEVITGFGGRLFDVITGLIDGLRRLIARLFGRFDEPFV